jgi:hypothetical protein
MLIDVLQIILFYLPVGIIAWVFIFYISLNIYKTSKKNKKKETIDSLNKLFFKKDNFKNFKDWDEN